MAVSELKELCDKAIADDFGDAIVMAQANADHISEWRSCNSKSGGIV
jgi:hypothetical protein